MHSKQPSLNRRNSRRKTATTQMISFALYHNPIMIIYLAVVTTNIFNAEIR